MMTVAAPDQCLPIRHATRTETEGLDRVTRTQSATAQLEISITQKPIADLLVDPRHPGGCFEAMTLTDRGQKPHSRRRRKRQHHEEQPPEGALRRSIESREPQTLQLNKPPSAWVHAIGPSGTPRVRGTAAARHGGSGVPQVGSLPSRWGEAFHIRVTNSSEAGLTEAFHEVIDQNSPTGNAPRRHKIVGASAQAGGVVGFPIYYVEVDITGDEASAD